MSLNRFIPFVICFSYVCINNSESKSKSPSVATTKPFLGGKPRCGIEHIQDTLLFLGRGVCLWLSRSFCGSLCTVKQCLESSQKGMDILMHCRNNLQVLPLCLERPPGLSIILQCRNFLTSKLGECRINVKTAFLSASSVPGAPGHSS